MAEVKLLTEAEAKEWQFDAGQTRFLRERGMIAPEPDPLRASAECLVDGWDAGDFGTVHELALAALRRGMELAPAASPWRQIETAPKDGTFILAVQGGRHPDGRFYVPAVVQWKCGIWQTIDDDCPDEGWPLSHWMPLPANPALTEGQSK